MGDAGVIRRLSFAGALNFRDIGGYPVAAGGLTRWQAVYRSDSLHYLTNSDLLTFDALGIRAIYDLRRPGELARFPGPRAHVHLEVVSGDLGARAAASLRTRRDGEQWLAADYRPCSPERRRPSGACCPVSLLTGSFPR
jgi:protein-tyrosine phosphatase